VSTRRAAAGSRLAAVSRTVSGVLTGGLVILAIVVLGAAILASRRAVAGPAPSMVVIHLAVAAGAVTVQVLADRRATAGAVGAGVVVVGLSAGLLWTQWWA